MAKRKLRIVKPAAPFEGVCERCGSRFDSESLEWSIAEPEIATLFDAHKCVPLDSSQRALRVVREATDGK